MNADSLLRDLLTYYTTNPIPCGVANIIRKHITPDVETRFAEDAGDAAALFSRNQELINAPFNQQVENLVKLATAANKILRSEREAPTPKET